jgi:hypothetical protein
MKGETAMPHCADCGYYYECSREDHWIFCEARTCVVCMRAFEHVLPPDMMGNRVCDGCLTEDGTGGGAVYSGEEEDEL